jgi:hypothetical protein
MKTLYQAASAIEAHMIVQLLKQEGMDAHIEGEHLQGALGELPAAGLIRVVVNEADYPQARTVVDRWDADQPVQVAQARAEPKPFQWFYGLVIGAVLGVASSYAYFRMPMFENSTDFDRDGDVIEKLTYSADRTPLKREVDRNQDKKIDFIAHYDASGKTEQVLRDDNFDGVFETKLRFKQGSLEYSATDTDGDGYADLRSNYAYSVTVKTEFINPSTGLALRVEYFKLGKLTVAEMDTDRDGKLDTRYVYGPLGQVVSTEAIKN